MATAQHGHSMATVQRSAAQHIAAQRTLSPLKLGSAPVGTMGWVGRKGARCAFTPMGPMPAASRGGKQQAAHGQQADLWMAGAAPAQVGLHMQALSLCQMVKDFMCESWCRASTLPGPAPPRTRAAAAVGDAEGLVQVQVAHIGTNDAGGGQAHLRQAQRWAAGQV